MGNNRIFTRVGAFMLAMLLLFSTAACGNDAGETTKDTKGTESEKDTAKGDTQAEGEAPDPFGAYDEEITYTVGRTTLQNPKLPEGDTYEDNAYTRYVKEKLNARIVDAFEANDEDYDRQVSLAIASGDLPDMMKIVDKSVLDELVENDLIADLTEVYQDYATDYIKECYDSYDGRALDTVTYDGKIMALPGTNVDSAPLQVWMRKDWIDKLGLKVDEDNNGCITIEELESIAADFMAADPSDTGNPVGVALSYTLNSSDYGGATYCMTGIANAFGAFPQLWLKDGSGQAYYGSNTTEMKESLGLLAEWFDKGLLDPQFGTRTWDDITALMTNGQCGIAFGVWHIPDWLLSNVRAMDNEADFVSYVIEDGSGKVPVSHNNAAGGFIVVRKDYEYPELAMKIINIFYDELANSKTLATDAPEVNEYLTTGVDGSVRPFSIEINPYTSLLDDYYEIRKGVNGEITSDEAPTVEAKNVIEQVLVYLDDPANSEVVNWSRYLSRMVGIELIDKLTVTDAFVWTEPVFWGTTETMKSKWANLKKLEEETFIKIITGEMSIDEFDTYVENWNSQGGTEILAEIQEQID